MQGFRFFLPGASLVLALGVLAAAAQRAAGQPAAPSGGASRAALSGSAPSGGAPRVAPFGGVPRLEVSFDRGWERYAIDSPNAPAGAGRVRQGTAFTGQFTDEHVAAAGSDEISSATRGFNREYPLIRGAYWTRVTLPASARDESELNPGPRQFVGICYYRKRFRVPTDGREYSLRFDAAMQVASVWVNGRFVLQHQGGYLPFTVPVFRGDSVIVVRVDNRNNNQTPPGKSLERLGFLYWSGIYRNVWLVGLPPRHIDVFARYEEVSDSSATVVVRTTATDDVQILAMRAWARHKADARVRLMAGTRIRQMLDGQIMAEGDATDSLVQRFTVVHPHLWSPEDPHLYTLRTQLLSGGRVIDEEVHRIGIRSLAFSRAHGFVLNGRPYRIVGTNRHQDHPYIGNALSAAANYRDLKRIKDAGMNFVRLAHYPQDPSVYEVCDSIGLMVADPIPGWQFFNNSERFRSRVFRDIRETVRRDRNHPCVIMWEMSLNESYPPDSFRIASARVAHEEYPGDQFFTSGDTYGAQHTAWDVPYNSWEDPFGRPQDVQPLQPGFVREYGHYEFGGAESTTNANASTGEASLLHNAWNVQWEHNLLRGPSYYPWTVGDANWAFYDGFEAPTKGTTDWGVMDVFRLPKFSYYFFQSQAARPMVYIANWWTPFDTSGKVVIYSNADSVALYRDGTLLAVRSPDDGPDSGYGDWDHGGNPFDGGNARHLAHPPFTFTGIRFTPGALKAVGYRHGVPVAFDVRRTPGVPARLTLDADLQGMPLQANGVDVVFVHASLVDSAGAVEVLDNATEVAFSVSGEGVAAGPSTAPLRGGVATILVRSTGRVGTIRINAVCKGIHKSLILQTQ
ncbi:glycoside hydrolase family 2 protein [Dinghuibacter silviterrae]|uniref:Beta-galactosidase n=1 Tax=Dinghuibacter silviterrae TaxID=1539049 RepID=A0A4R8DJ43_9BACT|nr:glycoside hydrolase family 2 TIM barrel-domain containing protein [Dinghuibacter silviterrae]TDW97538.1 beta-galactosidase [Dinghuibacter silviterrae]